ncbi:MAG: hypothetical protein ACTSX6_05005, partial [Candidatus Heimdallarchaeaceae archaeon]
VVSSIRWSEYGLTRQSDPLAIAVSIVSTKIPFPETSKEYISQVPELEEEIRLALLQLGRRLKTFLSRAKRRRREHARLSRFVRSAPVVVDNLTQILEDEEISLTDFRFEKNRIASALAHGAPKKVKLFMPVGERLYGLNVWCPSSVQTLLKSKKIFTISKFLLSSAQELANLLTLSEEQIYEIKLRTIFELDKEGLSPGFDPKIFVIKAIEKRFDKEAGKSSISLKDALSRRWIQNSYHYLATDYSKLRTVTNLSEKLFENKKNELLNQLILSGRKSDGSNKQKRSLKSISKLADLTVSDLFPTFGYLKEHSNGLLPKETSVEDFLFQVRYPNSVIYQPEITTVLIDYLKSVFAQLIEKYPNFTETNITKMKPDWTDGYTKNAFHRRKIKTISDFIERKTEELISIKEMERTLYSLFLDLLTKESSSINLSRLSMTNIAELKADETALKQKLNKLGIKTLAHLVNLSSKIIYEKKFDELERFLLKETKYKLLIHLEEHAKDYDISHIKIISQNVEKELNKRLIFSSSMFLASPSSQLRKMGLKKRDVDRIKKILGTSLPKWLEKNELIKKCGIVCLEELFYSPPQEYALTSEEKKSYLDLVTLLRSPLIFALPELRESSNLLNEVGLNCLGRFLLWPNNELAEILTVEEAEVVKLKKSISKENVQKNKTNLGKKLKDLSKLFPRLTKYFDSPELTIQDLFYLYPTEDTHLNQGFWKKFKKISDLSKLEIVELFQLYDKKSKDFTILKDALLKLKARNIETIRQFLDLLPEVIESELTSVKERKIVLELYHKIKNRELPEEEEFHKQIILLSEFDEFQRVLNLPISRLSNISLSDYENLRNNNIIAIHQLFEYTNAELASFLGIEEKAVDKLFSEFSVEKKGTPYFEKAERNTYRSLISFEFEDSERFSTHEILSLILAGYDSVDKIFYLAHPMTFSASLVNWTVIDKFRKLLRSPLTLVTWEKIIKKNVLSEDGSSREVEETKMVTLSTKQLNVLSNNGITRIIDLLIVKVTKLAEILQISEEEASELQKNIRISDTGTDLADLEIFKPHIVEILEKHNIVTLEDLYFSTSKSKWKIQEIPWSAIESIKPILNLSLDHFPDMLDNEIIEILKKANIFTLLGFMLTSPEKIMDLTGIPDERVENIKRSIHLPDIISYFSLPSYFLPKLTFAQTEKLRANKVKTIADFILCSSQKINKLIKLPQKEFKEISSSLTSLNLQALYEEKGIFAFETKLFDKLEQRTLSRDSIFQFERFQTLQEMYFEIQPEYYRSNPELLTKVLTVKKILDLPLHIFSEISEYSLEVLANNNIKQVFQLLFIPDEELTDPLLYRSISTYSSKIIIMRAFHYFAKLPANVYNSAYFRKILGNIEELTLSDVITDPKIISDLLSKDKQYLLENYNLTLIRSLLELPLRITPFFTKIKKVRREEYKDFKIGDVFEIDLEEHPALSLFYKTLQEQDSFNKLISDLAIPISSMGLPKELSLKLLRASIFTLIDFFSAPIKQIAEITGFSQKYLRKIKNNLNYPDIVSFRLSQAHAISPSTLLNEKQISQLKEAGIVDIESLYFSANSQGISKILTAENYNKIKEILSGSIRFISFLSFDEIKRLEYYEIYSVIDLSLLSKKELFEITKNPIYKEFHVLDLISFDEIIEKRKQTAVPLSLLPSIEEDYLEKIKEIGIHSIQDFNSRIPELRESHPNLVRLDIFKEVQLYLSSVAFIGLDNKYVQKLIYSGVGDILTFITEDVSTIALLLGFEENEVLKYVQHITPANLLLEIEKKGVHIESFPIISKSTKNYLLKIDRTIVQDVYSQYYQAFSISDVTDAVLDDILSACNVSIYRINELSAKQKQLLSKEGLLRIIDLFCSNDSELKRIFGGKIPSIVLEVRKGNFTLNKGKPLALNEPMQQLLTDLHFDPSKKAVEDLFGFVPEHLLQFSETERIEKIQNISFVEQLISFLCLNTLSLPKFSLEAKKALWENGIKHVIELISLDIKQLENVSKEVKRELRKFQGRFHITTQMSETFTPYLDHDINLPSKIKEKFKSYGLSSAILLVDFLLHPIFNFSNKEQSVLQTVSNNMFKPIIWLDLSSLFKISDLVNFQKKGISNLLSLALYLQAQETELSPSPAKSLSTEFIKILNKEISKLKPPIWAIELSKSKLLTDTKLIKQLKKMKITYISELLVSGSIFVLNKEIYSKTKPILFSLKNFSISSIEVLDSRLSRKLKNKGVDNVFQLLLLPSPLLSEVLNVPLEKITEIKSNISLLELQESTKTLGFDLSLFPELSKKAQATLSEYGCVSLKQIIKMDVKSLPLAVTDQDVVLKLTNLVMTPITIIGKVLKLKNNKIDELLEQSFCVYEDLLEVPQKNWPSTLKILVEKQKSDPSYLLKKFSKPEKFGLSIESLNLPQGM